jgi:hypothetical protein
MKNRFQQIAKQNPGWSSYICFAELVRKVKMTQYEIRKWFSQLVDKDDYSRSDLNEILNHLYDIGLK